MAGEPSGDLLASLLLQGMRRRNMHLWLGDYLRRRAALIGAKSMGRAEAGRPRGATMTLADDRSPELPSTTQIAVVDGFGHALAMTSTIENGFGAQIMVRGFLLNNQLTDFSFVPEENGVPVANRVQAGKRPRSSMAPLLVFERDSGAFEMALGSPGGAAIIAYVAKSLIGVLDWQLDLQRSIALPNFGSRNGPTELEAGRSSAALVDALSVVTLDALSDGGAVDDVEAAATRLADLRERPHHQRRQNETQELAGNCSLIGIDASKAMIEKAYSKLTSLNQPSYDIQFECRELQNVVLNDAAMVILNYTLQFIKVLDRPLILKKIFDGLKPQGILYLSEKIKFKDPVFQENATFIYENFKEQAGYSKIEIARKKEALENVLVPFSLPEILQMLHECGFASAEPIMQWNNFVSIIARKK